MANMLLCIGIILHGVELCEATIHGKPSDRTEDELILDAVLYHLTLVLSYFPNIHIYLYIYIYIYI